MGGVTVVIFGGLFPGPGVTVARANTAQAKKFLELRIPWLLPSGHQHNYKKRMVKRCLTAGTYVRGTICVSLEQCQVVTHGNWKCVMSIIIMLLLTIELHPHHRVQ